MDRKERQWLVSVLMTIVMTMSVFSVPASAFAADGEPFGGSIDTYINSDGQQVTVETTDDGFVYQKVNSDGQDVIKIYGYVGGGTSITVPEQIDNTNVVSFAIDPRWPVGDEDYDQIVSLILPKTIRYAHSAYIEEFRGLKSVKIAAENTTYKSDKQDVLYKFNEDGCHVAAYPRARTSKTFVMPDDMNRFYEFFEGCQLETITISAEMPYVCADDFYNLRKLKNVYVNEDNASYYTSGGVLFTDDPDCIDSIEDDDEDEEPVDEDEGDEGGTGDDDEEDDEEEEDDGELVALCYYPAGKTETEYDEIPANVTNIEDGAFAYNQYLQKITIPASVEVIAEDALIYLEDYMDGEDLLADPVLKTLVFKSTDVSDIYTDFKGVKTLYSVLKDKLNIRYSSAWKGYTEFLAWLKEEDDADIEQEENSWDEAPKMLESYPLGANIIFLGKPHYGSAYAIFSSSEDGTYIKQEPSSVGTWYAKLVVDETKEYTELESEPMSFTIYEQQDDQQQNRWAYIPAKRTEVNYGEDFDVSVPALFGETRVLYGTPNSNPEATDDPEQWTEEKPEEPGEYAYALIVDETEKYAGLKFVSSYETNIHINRAPFELRVICDDVAERSEPSPRVEFFRGTETDKIDLSKIGFIYGTYETVEGAGSDDPEIGNEPNDEEFVPMTGVPVDPGEYVVRAVCKGNYYNEYYEIFGETTFSIKSALEIVEDMIDAIAAPKDISVYSKEEVQKAIDAYEELPESVQALISRDKVQDLYDAKVRIESLEAKAEYDEKKRVYDQALAEYNTAKAAADSSKAAAEAAAKTPGAAAVTAAEKAEDDANALKEAAEKLQAATDELTPAAENYADKAQDDPVMTRRDKTDANKAAANAETAADSAGTAVTDAGQAVIDAGTAKYNAETLAEAAKEDYTKKVASAKKLKVSGLKVKALRKKKAAVTWKVNKKGTGYDLRYSRKKNMKKAKKITIKKAKIKKATLKKLKARKYYYVRIRTITKLVDPETGKTVTVYGKWTKVKRFKAKK